MRRAYEGADVLAHTSLSPPLPRGVACAPITRRRSITHGVPSWFIATAIGGKRYGGGGRRHVSQTCVANLRVRNEPLIMFNPDTPLVPYRVWCLLYCTQQGKLHGLVRLHPLTFMVTNGHVPIDLSFPHFFVLSRGCRINCLRAIPPPSARDNPLLAIQLSLRNDVLKNVCNVHITMMCCCHIAT